MYEKQNFYSGQKLMASQLDAMEDGIIEALNKESTSSWNDLEDKPFGEEVTNLGDTVTWDGVTNEHTTIFSGGAVRVQHVSDGVPTLEECVGSTLVAAGPNGEMPVEMTSANILQITEQVCALTLEPGVVESSGAMIVSEDNVDLGGDVFPKKGVYLVRAWTGVDENDGYMLGKSLTIPNYEFTTTVVKKIDPKYLPDGIGYETVGTTDTLTWDGTTDNTTVSPYEGFYLHPVTDQAPAMEQVVGSTMKYDLQGQEYSVEITSAMVQSLMDGLYGIATSDNLDSPGGTIYVATADNANMEGIVFPKKGMYFMAMAQMALVTKSITVPNYEFTTTVVKKIDPKYLPDDIGGGAKSWNDLEDKPFYEDVTVIGDTINYDGHATDVNGSIMGGSLPMSRVSADAPTAKELIGGVIALTSGGEVMEFVIAEGNIFDYGSYAVIGGIQDLGQPDLPAVAIAYEDGINSTEAIDAVLPQKGTYLVSAVSYGICTSKFYVPNFTFTAGVLKRIDKKFMPPIPTFNLEAMGLGTVTKGNILEIEADTSALLAALEEGQVWVSFAYGDRDYIMSSLVSATKNLSQGYTFFYVPVTLVSEPFIAEFAVAKNMLGVETYDLTRSASSATT